MSLVIKTLGDAIPFCFFLLQPGQFIRSGEPVLSIDWSGKKPYLIATTALSVTRKDKKEMQNSKLTIVGVDISKAYFDICITAADGKNTKGKLMEEPDSYILGERPR